MSKTANPETKNQKGVKNRIQIEIPGQQILQYRIVNKRHRMCARLAGKACAHSIKSGSRVSDQTKHVKNHQNKYGTRTRSFYWFGTSVLEPSVCDRQIQMVSQSHSSTLCMYGLMSSLLLVQNVNLNIYIILYIILENLYLYPSFFTLSCRISSVPTSPLFVSYNLS